MNGTVVIHVIVRLAAVYVDVTLCSPLDVVA